MSLEEFLRPLTDKEVEDRTAIVRAAKTAKGYTCRLTPSQLTLLLGPSLEDMLDQYIEDNPESRHKWAVELFPGVPELQGDFDRAVRRWRSRKSRLKAKNNDQANRPDRTYGVRQPGSYRSELP